jgi:hypothetical protein
LDLQKYGDTSTIQNDLHGFRGFGKWNVETGSMYLCWNYLGCALP